MKSKTVLNSEAIPDELKQLSQWVCWKFERRGDKETKIPYDAKRGGPASSTDGETWCSCEAALAAYESSSDYAGIGFVFSATDPYCGVDLDDQPIEDDRIEARAVHSHSSGTHSTSERRVTSARGRSGSGSQSRLASFYAYRCARRKR